MIMELDERQIQDDRQLKRYDPETYTRIRDYVAEQRKDREGYLSGIATIMEEALRADVEGLLIHGRPKTFSSIYRKMQRTGKDIPDIYDLLGLRVICTSIDGCYTVLRKVHSLWRPLPGRTKDYIANPKATGYRSIHTAVTAFGGRTVEIQIRTHDMHLSAEFGTASHRHYKRRACTRSGWQRQAVSGIMRS
jgi:GTP diphosphokinase / guanosine-3',5'-bis(diphosphate) 3'-diphosphatase